MSNSLRRFVERLFSQSSVRLWQRLVWGVLILHGLSLVLPLGIALHYTAWMQVVATVLNVIVAAWAFWTVRSPQDPKLRRFWQMTSLALAAYLGGDFFWALHQNQAWSSWAHPMSSGFYLVSSVFFLSGVFFAPTDRLLPIRRLKNLLDVLVAFLSATFVFIVVIIHPILENPSSDLWAALPEIRSGSRGWPDR